MEKCSLEVRFLPHLLAPPFLTRGHPWSMLPAPWWSPAALAFGFLSCPFLLVSTCPANWSPKMWQAEWSPPNVSALISRSCGYVTLHGKEDFAAVIKLRILGRGDDPGLLNGFLAVVSVRCDDGCRGREKQCCWLGRWKRPQARDCGQPAEAEKGKEPALPTPWY